MRWLAFGLFIAVALCVTPGGADATTMVPVSDAELVDGATAIVVARVTGLQSLPDPSGRRVVTDVSITVDEVLAGNVATRTLRVRIPGGRVSGLEMRVHGAPQFRIGERAVLFLTVGRDGTLRVAHLSQGKWSVEVDGASGAELAVRTEAPDVRMLAPVAVSAAATLGSGEVRRLEDLRRLVRQRRASQRTSVVLAGADTAPPSGAVAQTSASFTFLGAGARWFEPDSEEGIVLVAPRDGFLQVNQAAGAWNAIADSAARIDLRPTDTPVPFAFDGTNAIVFRDPSGVIDPPIGCRGTLAVTIVYVAPAETRVVRGRTFARIIEADIAVADGWDGCGFYESPANLTEVLAHEMGHLLGLGHSNDPDATMASAVHFDGRGGAPATVLEDDDRAGAVFLYPRWAMVSTSAVDDAGVVSGAVNLSPRGVSCGVGCDVYPADTLVTATATPQPGFQFVEWVDSPGCGGPVCTFTTAPGSIALRARFRSSLALAFTAPAAGETVRGIVTVSLAATGGRLRYSFLVENGGTRIYAGSPSSFAWDTTRFPDGDRILTATVTDAIGRRNSATLLVRIANGAGYIATLTVPAPDTRLRGTVPVMMSTTVTDQPQTFQLLLDGVEIFATTTAASAAQYLWDTTRAPNGAHRLRLEVSRGAQSAGHQRDVTVVNPPLTAAFAVPAAGATVSRTTTVRMSRGGAVGPATFALAVDGVEVSRQTVAATSATYAWDTTGVANGSHTMTLTVTEPGGRTATVTRTVTVDNRITASITAPASGAVVRRTVTVAISTTAPAGRARTFTLAIDGRDVTAVTITATTARIPIDTLTLPNGAHTLRVTVTWSGQTATATRSIIVAN